MLHFHTGLQDRVNVLIQPVFGQTIIGNPVPEHTAQLRQHLKYGCLVSHQLQIVSRAKPSRASAKHCHFLAGGRGACRRVYLACVICRHPLQPADIHRVIHHISPASRLTGMLTDKTTCGGERIVLADQTDSIRIASLSDQGNIPRDIHMSRT